MDAWPRARRGDVWRSAAVWFGVTGAVSGEFNYQGGEPPDVLQEVSVRRPGWTWDHRQAARSSRTGAAVKVVNEARRRRGSCGTSSTFLVGRHFGFIPYFFPGVVVVAAWLLSSARRDAWRVLTFLAFAVSALGFARAAVHVERGRRAGGQSLSLERLRRAVFPGAADAVRMARRSRVDGRRAVHGEDADESVRCGEVPYLTTERGPRAACRSN